MRRRPPLAHREDSRFIPNLPAWPLADENPGQWGHAGSRFQLDADGHVVMTGGRYAISGKPLKKLLPWFRSIIALPLAADDIIPSTFPPSVPAPVQNLAFLETLRAHLPEEAVSQDGAVRLRHGHGHTQGELHDLHHGHVTRVPDLVVFPTEEEQVLALVDLARAHDVVLVPYGGGTNVTEALKCRPEERRMIVSVDMRRMNRIRWVDRVNGMACIEAGATGSQLVEQLAELGLTMGHEPDSLEFSTLGGWVATHASGMKKNRYGNIEDIVLDVRVATAQGLLHRQAVAPRESVGIDPRWWLFGSEGKLGIVTAAIVKVHPLPEVQAYDSVLLPDFRAGIAFMHDLSRTRPWPASARLVDNVQFQFAMAFKPESQGLHKLKSTLSRLLVTRVLGYAPDRMVACTLVFEGTRAEVKAQRQTLAALAKRHGGMLAGGENGASGYQLTFAIAYIRDFMARHWVLAESFETSVPWSKVESLCDRVKARIRDEHERRGLPGKPFVSCRVTQLYETGACVYFYFAFHHKGVERPMEVYAAIEHAAREEILACGGSLSHHHGIGKLREGFMADILSPAGLAWQEQVKRALDPTDVFGCGNQSVEVAHG